MATLPLAQNAERLGRLHGHLIGLFAWAGEQSRATDLERPGDARTFAEWSNRLADHAALVAARVPQVAGAAGVDLAPDTPSAVLPSTGSERIDTFRAALAELAAEVADHRRLVDARTDGPTARLLDRLAHDLGDVT